MKWSLQPERSGQNYHEISHYNLYGVVIITILRVLYTIVEWLLKSARQDNCTAALNGLCGFEQIRPIKCPAVPLRASYSTLL